MFTDGVAMVYNGCRKGACTQMKKDTRDLILFLLWIFFYIILPFFIIPSCSSSHSRGHTSYTDEEVKDYGKVIYYQGQWQ